MRKKLTLVTTLLLLIIINAKSQSKVFKEVANQISSTTRTISQNGNVIGYLVFTQLEKVNTDSFSYKITILDENLNDIGKVEFNQLWLQLQDLTFENDLIHLGYLQSTGMGKKFKNYKDYDKSMVASISHIYIQTINLEGKIVNSINRLVSLKTESSYYYYDAKGRLASNIQLSPVGNEGFLCFYQDKDEAILLHYNSNSELQWSKTLSKDNTRFNTLYNNNNAYVFCNETIDKLETRVLRGYDIKTGNQSLKYNFIDKKSKVPLSLLDVYSDNKSGNLAVTGKIFRKYTYYANTFMENRKGLVSGVFTMIFNPNSKDSIKETLTYWDDKSMMPTLSKKGRIEETKTYPRIVSSMRDFNGNTQFIGYGVRIKSRIGAILFSIPPQLGIWVAILQGYRKMRYTDGLIFKQTSDGKYAKVADIELKKDRFRSLGSSKIVAPSFFTTKNTTTKTNYVIYDDDKNYIVFNTSTNKVIKKIPQKAGRKVDIEVARAKEGHIMILENNKKEKTMTLSIEAIE